MKPNPLPPNPKFSDRLEHVLQVLSSWAIINLRGKPMLSGLATGTIMLGLVLLVSALINLAILIVTGHWK
jgi:hypothetical protein